jgi:hypothetical protein
MTRRLFVLIELQTPKAPVEAHHEAGDRCHIDVSRHHDEAKTAGASFTNRDRITPISTHTTMATMDAMRPAMKLLR